MNILWCGAVIAVLKFPTNKYVINFRKWQTWNKSSSDHSQIWGTTTLFRLVQNMSRSVVSCFCYSKSYEFANAPFMNLLLPKINSVKLLQNELPNYQKVKCWPCFRSAIETMMLSSEVFVFKCQKLLLFSFWQFLVSPSQFFLLRFLPFQSIHSNFIFDVKRISFISFSFSYLYLFYSDAYNCRDYLEADWFIASDRRRPNPRNPRLKPHRAAQKLCTITYSAI